MPPRIRMSLLALGFGLVAALLVSEAVVRFAKRFTCFTQIASVYEPHPVYGWGHIPSTASWQQGCDGRKTEFRVLVRTNALGLRDVELSYDRAPGRKRVLVLGDSVVEASQVELSQTFPKQLETLLRGDGLRVEVLNAGTAGYGTDNQLLFFREEGRKYRPDLVVSAFDLINDLADNHPELYRRTYAQAGKDPLPKARVTRTPDGGLRFDFDTLAREIAERRKADHARSSGPLAFLERNFYLVRAAMRFARRAESAPPAAPAMSIPLLAHAVPPDEQWEEAWANTRALLRALADDVRRGGAEFLVVIIPEPFVFRHWLRDDAPLPERPRQTWSADYPRTRLRSLLEEERIPYVDATDALDAARTNGEVVFYPRDLHPTATGHRVIAEVLHQAVRDRLVEAD